VPDGVFGDGSVLFCRLVERSPLPQYSMRDIENPRVSVDVSVVISYNVIVVKVLEDVSVCRCCQSVLKL
jgi:hypothetical protein